MQADRVQVLVQQAAAGNVEALVALVQEFAPGLRLMLGAHLDQPAALVLVEIAVWSAVRTRLGEWLPDTPFPEWLQQVAMGPITTHLAHADRRAIDIQDALSHQIIEHCREAIANGSELGIVDLPQRIAALPETTRTLLLRRYRERQRPAALAASLMISEPELATSLVAARAACDWTGLAKPPGSGDRLTPPLIEDWLNGTIDVDSRALLATNMARDLERARQFARQVRIHLALSAALAPFTHEDAVVIARQTGIGAGDSGRVMMGDAPRTTSGPRTPTSDPRRQARMTTSNHRQVSVDAEAPRPSPMPWIIGGGMVLVGIFAVVVMSLGSGARKNSPARPADAPTASAPANTTPPSTSTPAPGSGGILRLDPGRNSTAPQRPGAAPVVSITGAATSGKVCQDAPLELRASLSHIIGVKAVEFYHGDQRLGTVDVAPYRWTWEQPASGSVSLTARVIGQAGVLATSLPVTLEILPPLGSGKLRREWWSSVGGQLVADGVTVAGYPDRPQGSDEIDRFASPQNTNDNYLQRLRGYIHPPLDGEYTFWIAADDEAQLWLSEDDTRVRLRQIATAPLTDGGGLKVEEWERDERQHSASIHLRRGQRYYVEVLHKEGEASDHVEVGWRLPNGQLQRPIPGRHLSPANEPVAASAVVIAAAPVALPPASVTTPNAPTTPTTPAVGPRFVTGINFGGDAVVIDGNKWLSHKQAEEAAATLGAQVIALNDLNWVKAQTGHGEVQKNRTFDSKPLTLRGVVYPKGLGTHAPSEITYALAGRFAAFMCDVGIDDETNGAGSAIFRVLVDGQQVFDSGLLTHGSPVKRLNVPVNGGKELKLVVLNANNDDFGDHADWAGARLAGAGPVGGVVVKSGRRTSGVMNPKPAVDAPMRGMLTSSLVGTAKEGLSFIVRVPQGSYEVYVWTAETSVTNARLFDLHLGGVAMGEIGALPIHGWAKYGPFPVTIEAGELEVLAKPKKGVPQLTGIAIFESATAAPNLEPVPNK